MISRKSVLEALSVICIILLVYAPLVFDLDAFRAPDEDRWIGRTTAFVKDLAFGNFDKLLKNPTPGVMLQWAGAPANNYEDWTIKKLPLVIIEGLLVLTIGYVFSCLWGKKIGYLLLVMISINSLLIGLERVYGTDALFSLFCILSLGLLLLWEKNRNLRYLIAAGITSAATILTKLPGIILIPFSLLFLLYYLRKNSWKNLVTISSLKHIGIWCLSLVVGLIIFLPPIALAPLNVINEILSTFGSDGYTELHAAGRLYYFKGLAFFSNPLNYIALFAFIPLVIASLKKRNYRQWQGVVFLLFFGALYFTMMTIGSKKGYRYLLPVFLIADIVTAYVIPHTYYFLRASKRNLAALAFLCLTGIVLAWQVKTTISLYPHNIAYVNPLIKQFFGNTRYGWGEGLDLAAAYLNTKPNAKQLKVATYYPSEFGSKFIGESVSANQDESGDPDYTIVYRAMFERGKDAWETDIVNRYSNIEPEKVIGFEGIDYVWIYKRK